MKWQSKAMGVVRSKGLDSDEQTEVRGSIPVHINATSRVQKFSFCSSKADTSIFLVS
jgi:hypothetical protein